MGDLEIMSDHHPTSNRTKPPTDMKQQQPANGNLQTVMNPQHFPTLSQLNATKKLIVPGTVIIIYYLHNTVRPS